MFTLYNVRYCYLSLGCETNSNILFYQSFFIGCETNRNILFDQYFFIFH